MIGYIYKSIAWGPGGGGAWLWTIKWWSLWDAHAWQTFKILTLYHLQKLTYLAQWWPFKRSRCLSSMKLLHHSQSQNASLFLSCPPKYHPMDHNDSEDNFSDRRRSSDEYLKLKPWEYFYLREIFWNNFDRTREIHHTRHAAHWTVDTYMLCTEPVALVINRVIRIFIIILPPH